MSTLITIHDGTPTTTSIAIAEGTKRSHESVIKLVRKYQSDLKEFGPLGFEIRKGEKLPQGGFAKATEIARLNERQSTLLMTYMRNTAIVREFKKRLVKGFYQMAEKQAKTTPSSKPTQKQPPQENIFDQIFPRRKESEMILIDPDRLMEAFKAAIKQATVDSYHVIPTLKVNAKQHPQMMQDIADILNRGVL